MTVISKFEKFVNVLSKFRGSFVTFSTRMASSEANPIVEAALEKGNQNTEESTDGAEKSEEKAGPSYILVDIGANLTNKKFSRDLEAVVRRAKDAAPEKRVESNDQSEEMPVFQPKPGTFAADCIAFMATIPKYAKMLPLRAPGLMPPMSTIEVGVEGKDVRDGFDDDNEDLDEDCHEYWYQ